MSTRSLLKSLYIEYIQKRSVTVHNRIVNAYNSLTDKDRNDASIFSLYDKYRTTGDMFARFTLYNFLSKYE